MRAIKGGRSNKDLSGSAARSNLGIVQRGDAGEFVVWPNRFVAERTIAWLDRCWRSIKDCEFLHPNALPSLR